MIPKVIHYCWFGGNPFPDLAERCLASWKKYCPDYDIRRWDESNFDIACCDYVKEAYSAKKWAFVSDYARLFILYEYGGIYLDTDVELVSSIDDIIARGSFMGMERNFNREKIIDNINAINMGLGSGMEPGQPIINEILESYQQDSFIDKYGVQNLYTIVERTTEIFVRHGFDTRKNVIQSVSGVTIYPRDYFCPMDYVSGKIIETANTRSIHHYSATWLSTTQKRINLINNKYSIKKGIYPKIGRILTIPYIIKDKIETAGLKKTIYLIISKIKKTV